MLVSVVSSQEQNKNRSTNFTKKKKKNDRKQHKKADKLPASTYKVVNIAVKMIGDASFFFYYGGRSSNPELCIYYALSISTKLTSHEHS